MFIDKANVELQAGDGGNGMISFRREKYVPFGGPNGGNGGRGGSIYFRATTNVSTLSNFRFNKVLKAENGVNGGSKNSFGRKGEDLIVEVPVGTLVYLTDTNKLLADLDEVGKEVLLAKGGRGGRGNAAFRTSTRKAPRIAENGEKGEKHRLTLELKLLADVGFVGMPNVGKSTLLSVISNAKPEIADYPFTTLTPQLGVTITKDRRSFVVADLPGLIEGASQGKGLGIQFLQHIERCRLLALVLDFESDSDPVKDYELLQDELKAYGYHLIERAQIVIATKFETEHSKKKLAKFNKKYPDIKVNPISSLLHEGIDELVYALADQLEKIPPVSFIPLEEEETYKIYKASEMEKEEPIFKVIRLSEHEYRIVGEKVVAQYHRLNLSTDEALLSLLKFLRNIGVDDELERLGLEDGDRVFLEDFEFEYIR